jgi:hypothetical protein
MRSSLFWDITQRVLIIPYRCFEKSYQFHLQRSRNPRKLDFLMSGRNCHHALRNIPEQRRSEGNDFLHRISGGSARNVKAPAVKSAAGGLTGW